MFPPIDPEMEQMAGEFEIHLVSPMAVAQRSVKSQGTDAFMAFIGQAAQFDQTILDNIDADVAARQRADIEGVDIGVLRPQEAVDQIRKQRAEAQAKQAEEERAMAMAQMQGQGANMDAQTRKTQAETGQILADTQQTNLESGVLQ